MTRLDAFHLPGLDCDGLACEHEVRGDIVLRHPRLEPRDLVAVVDALRQARSHLAGTPVATIVRTIDRVATRLADPADSLRRIAENALPAVTGYSPPMIRLILDRMSADWRAPALNALLRAELGGAEALEGFVPVPGGGRQHARGPELAFHVFSGNVPGIAVTSLVRSLLVRAATLGKTAAGDPLLPALFAHALADADPALGQCLAIAHWTGGNEELECVALEAADAVVVYGGAQAITELRRRTPSGTTLIEHGPRISFAAIAREAPNSDREASDLACAAARATAIFDQHGCVSPHLLYVEEGGVTDPRAFARLVAAAFHGIDADLPPGPLDAPAAAAIHDARATAEFRAIAGAHTAVHAGPDARWTVLFDADPAFEASCLNRVLRIKPVADLNEIPALIAPFRRFLQTAALAAPAPRRDTLARSLAAAGVTRITTLDAMPWPPPAAHHDGRGPLRELVRWVDLED